MSKVMFIWSGNCLASGYRRDTTMAKLQGWEAHFATNATRFTRERTR
jgi:hypothetical protein